jgi:RNA-binding motif X-linked protein 2
LKPELSEGDVLVIFSQYGVPVHLKLVRDKESGKSRGFGWLKYEDQRSTVLAVDNLNGSKVLGRMMKVDHAFYEEKEVDEEYERLLAEELKNDLASDLEEEEEVKDNNNEFQDPLLLMQKAEGKEKREHRHGDDRHRYRHRGHNDRHRERSSDKDRAKGRERDRDREHRGRHKSGEHKGRDDDKTTAEK